MTTILGYEFENPALLEEALVTPSCKMERPNIADNQRLEFLGDAVLGLLAADRLYAELPREQEGTLTIQRTHMVSAPALCRAAARLELVPLLKRSKGAAPLTAHSKTIADAVEAIMGAVWLDGGLKAAKQVFNTLYPPSSANQQSNNPALQQSNNATPIPHSQFSASSPDVPSPENPKGSLQIRAQAMKPPQHPVYELLSTKGRAHEPIFTVRVSVRGMGQATASARSRKEAEALAAAQLLSACGQ